VLDSQVIKWRRGLGLAPVSNIRTVKCSKAEHLFVDLDALIRQRRSNRSLWSPTLTADGKCMNFRRLAASVCDLDDNFYTKITQRCSGLMSLRIESQTQTPEFICLLSGLQADSWNVRANQS